MSYVLSLVKKWQIEINPVSYWSPVDWPTDDDLKVSIYALAGWDNVVAGIDLCAEIFADVDFWIEILRPVMKMQAGLKTTFLTVCLNDDLDCHGAGLQCKRLECHRLRDALQEYKDTVDMEEIVIMEENQEGHGLYKNRYDANEYDENGFDEDGLDSNGYKDDGHDKDRYDHSGN